MKRARHKKGSVVFDKRRRTWNYLFCENGVRRTKFIGTLREFPTKKTAWDAVDLLRRSMTNPADTSAITLNTLVDFYRKEKMPRRLSTRRAYESWLRNHLFPRWGNSLIGDIQARPVELWLQSLSLSPKSQVHIRGLLRGLWDMPCGAVKCRSSAIRWACSYSLGIASQ